MSALHFIRPYWPAPSRVRAAASTRSGGHSQAPFDSFNLGDHVADDPAAVGANRELLAETLALPEAPGWMTQVHGVDVLHRDAVTAGSAADACWSDRSGAVCAVLTADCLPVLFCDVAGSCVAAAHAGWRGLLDGVLEATVEALPAAESTLIAWLGPAIGPASFEVGDEVRDAFCARDPQAEKAFFPTTGEGQWLADLYLLARQRLAAVGVTAVYGGGFCSHTEHRRFFSYRRDGETGRMASLIWLQD